MCLQVDPLGHELEFMNAFFNFEGFAKKHSNIQNLKQKKKRRKWKERKQEETQQNNFVS